MSGLGAIVLCGSCPEGIFRGTIVLGGNCLGGNCLGGQLSRGEGGIVMFPYKIIFFTGKILLNAISLQMFQNKMKIFILINTSQSFAEHLRILKRCDLSAVISQCIDENNTHNKGCTG